MSNPSQPEAPHLPFVWTRGIAARETLLYLDSHGIDADPLLGVHVAAAMDLREIGLLFYLAASSATVADALEHLAEYAATTTEEIRLEISPGRDETLLTFHRVLAVDEPCRQHSELIAL